MAKNNTIILGSIIVFTSILFILAINIHAPTQYLELEEREPSVRDETKKGQKNGEIPSSVARKIKAEQLHEMKGIVKITWDVDPYYSDDFFIGRATEIIDTRQKALASETVQVIQGAQSNEVYDFVSAPGNFFYVVVSRKRINEHDIRLYKDENYTSLPVTISLNEAYYHVREIDTKSYDLRKIKITWQKIPREGIQYSIYRSNRRLDKFEKVQSAVKIADVIDRGEYYDEGIEIPGTYFYAITAREIKGPERMYPYPDHNYTVLGTKVIAEDVNKNALYRVRSIEATKHDNGVQLAWTYTGTIGNKFFRIFRSKQYPLTVREIKEDLFISDVEITKKGFTDPTPPSGDFYYGILPFGYVEENTPILRGVNITEYPMLSKGGGIPERKEEKTIDDKKRPVIEDVKRPETLPEKKQEKIDTVDAGNVDMILHKTFFKGKYDRCAKALQNLVSKTDNQYEKAKANLFLGRSFIELGQYRKALDYLLLNDVRKQFPKESRFWHEFAIRKIK